MVNVAGSNNLADGIFQRFPLSLNILVEFSNAYFLYKDEFSKIGCAYTRSEIF
jgi:hypothetical protein